MTNTNDNINGTAPVTEARNEYVRVNNLDRRGGEGATHLRRVWQLVEETEAMEWFRRDSWNSDTLTFGELQDIRPDLFQLVEEPV